MKMELLDQKQRQIGIWESVDSEFIERILSELSPKENFTLVIEHGVSSLMYIAFDRGLYTLLVQLGDDEFYDYISSVSEQGDIEFIEGGQKVVLDKQRLASYSAVREAIENFASNPDWVRTDSNWQQQV
jgi:hypothetical protein